MPAQCVKGRSHGKPHFRVDSEEKDQEEVSTVSVDYMFMGEHQKEGEEKGMPIMCIKDRKTKVIRARVTPQKGLHWYPVKVLTNFIRALGYTKVIVKSDQEPAILNLKEGVDNENSCEVVMEESPGYDSKGNGEIERAVQMVQEKFRAVKDGVE